MDSEIRSRPAVRPQRLGLLLCMHARVPVKPKMTSSSIHHRQKGRALPSAVQPLHRASEEGRGVEEGGREGEGESRRRTRRHKPGQTKTVCETPPPDAPSHQTHVLSEVQSSSREFARATKKKKRKGFSVKSAPSAV